MNETMNTLVNRRSIRCFNDIAVSKELVEQIVLAGEYAPCGMGKQAGKMLVVTDPELLETLRRLNCTSVGNEYTRDNFYGGKTVIVVFADSNVRTHIYDGSLVMGNLMNAAYSLGVGSIWIHRAKEVFETEEGKQLKKQLGIDESYVGIGHCVLGYYDGQAPVAKERKSDFVIWK